MSDILMSFATLLKRGPLQPLLRRSYEIPKTFEDAVDRRWEQLNVIEPPGKKHDVEKAIHNTVEYFFKNQHPEGYWIGELEANTSITAEYVMLMHFLDHVDEEKERKAVNYLLEKQLDNGAWDIYYGHPGDVSTTAECYFALKLAGHSPQEPYMKKARQFVHDNGGMIECRMMTRIVLAMFGQFPWRGLPNMPAEFMFMPKSFIFNIYNLASWARAIIVPLLVIFSFKPEKEIAPEKGIDELYHIPKDELDYSFGKAEKFFSWKNFFLWVDKFLKVTENNLQKITRRAALKKAEKWILDHQLDTGDCAGIYPAMSNTVIALSLLGYSHDSEPIKKGMEAIERFEIIEGDTLRLQSCVSPVWDTAWSVYALSTAGFTYRTPEVAKSMDWLFANQIKVKGDWAVKNPGVEAGGWAFEFHNDLAPDTDDSAVVLMALFNDNLQDPHKKKEFKRGLNWLLSMQNDDGGWGAFERNNDYLVFNDFPFSESDNLVDPSTSDVTGRILEAVGQMGMDRHHPQVKRAINYLKRDQSSFGGWYGRWGVNYVYGTWSVLCALRSVGENMQERYIQKAVQWLKSVQNDDGGWGESCKSYVDPDWIGKGDSTASQTAWGVMGLIAAGEDQSPEVERGIQYLLDTQKADGTWDEPEFTGTGFPTFFLIRYHMYRLYFPLLALARYRRIIQERERE